MNKNEENNYKEYAKETTPDLWNRIDSNLPEGMYTKDSSLEENNTKEKDNAQTNETIETTSSKKGKIIKFPTRKIYTFAGLIAACLFIVCIPLIINSTKNRVSKENATFNTVNKDSIDSNNIMSNENAITDNSIADNNNDNNKNNASNETENSIPGITNDNADNEQTNKDNTYNKEDDNMHPIITLKVTKHHTTDIGLVYECVIISTSSKSIKPKDTVFVTLRKLSRHDLLHTYKPGEEFTISLYDDTFSSSSNNPYYAYKMEK